MDFSGKKKKREKSPPLMMPAATVPARASSKGTRTTRSRLTTRAPYFYVDAVSERDFL